MSEELCYFHMPHDSCHSYQLVRHRTPSLAPCLPSTLNPSRRMAHHLYPRWSTRLGSVRIWSNMQLKGRRAGKWSSFQEVPCHMMSLINPCCCTQSWVFALSNSGTGLETQATSTVISHSHTETGGRAEILLVHCVTYRFLYNQPTVWKWGPSLLTVIILYMPLPFLKPFLLLSFKMVHIYIVYLSPSYTC